MATTVTTLLLAIVILLAALPYDVTSFTSLQTPYVNTPCVNIPYARYVRSGMLFLCGVPLHLPTAAATEPQQEQQIPIMPPGFADIASLSLSDTDIDTDDLASYYGDMLTMDKPLDDSDLSTELARDASILTGPPVLLSPGVYGEEFSIAPANRKPKPKPKWRPDWWSEPFEEICGKDLDDEEPVDPFVQELRDAYEQQLGRPIWSKRTPEELKRARKRDEDARAMELTPSVIQVITAAYLDRSCTTLRELKEDDPVALHEFKQWLSKTRKSPAFKNKKKDPLLQAKLDVVTMWLDRHPLDPAPRRIPRPREVVRPARAPSANRRFSGRGAGLGADPPIFRKTPTLTVMDDLLPLPYWQPKPVTAENLHFNALLSANSNNNGGAGGKQQMVTASMTNWDAALPAFPQKELNTYFSESELESESGIKSKSNSKSVGKSGNSPVFEVDGVEMFLATATAALPNNDYFVAL